MFRSSLAAIILSVLALSTAAPGGAQMPVADWTERPDSDAPAGLTDDALLAPRSYEVSYRFRIMTYEDLFFGTDRVPPVLVLQDWEMVPISMTTQRHELEFRAGMRDWLGFSLRIPVEHTSAELVTNHQFGEPSSFGLGDVEIHALYGLHDIWPHRAHLVSGVSLPTGSVSHRGRLPNAPEDRSVLPYPMQLGDGTFALLPGAVFVTENAAGTVGLKASARIPLGENERGWRRGNEVSAQLWMAYRFTDWISSSARISVRKGGNVGEHDPGMDPWSSPMAHPMAQGGTRVELPIGTNFLFPIGPLRGNRIGVEVLVPVHQNLDGPQLAANYGMALTWGVAF